ncbi:unnamed protein product [Symbiodinium sp. CCMP2592]|nr:unnamed protein product [Symbiodinium sp. CCMP2592]
MSFYEFKKLNLKPDEHPNLSRSDLWDQMPEHETVRSDLLLRREEHETRLKFEEEHDVGLVKKYASSCAARSANAENLKAYYESMLPAPKKGRKSLQQEELFTKNQSLIRKIVDHEARLAAVIAPRRRLKQKRSVEDGNPEDRNMQEIAAATYSSAKTIKQVEYAYSAKQKYSIQARRYGSVGSAQSISRRLQVHAVGGHTVDLDIHNCCLTLIYQIVQKLSPDPALPDDLDVVFKQVAEKRSDFITKIGLQHAEGKDVINTVFNGGAPPKKLKDCEEIKKLQRIALFVRWVACNLLHDDYRSLVDNKTKTFPTATIMSLMWNAVEDRILHVWSEYVLRGKPKHLSLHFDGLRVSTDAIENVDEYIRDCQEVILKQTSFNVKVVAKKHYNFIQLIHDQGTLVNKISNLPDLLKVSGNCIPCSMWHAMPTSKAAIVSAVQDDGQQENVDARKIGYRSYRSVAAMVKVDLVSCVGLPPNHLKNFLLHYDYEGNGVPHCVSIRFDTTNKIATVIDGADVYKLSIMKFQDACLSAVDRSTILTYWRRDTKDKTDAKSAILLDMAAGASQDSEADDSDEGMGDKCRSSHGMVRLSQDDAENPVISDNIIGSLCEETDAVLKDLGNKSPRVEGRRRCPLCPFRSFTQLRYLRTHVQKHHTAKNQYVYSGTKQIKVTLSLYDHAASSQTSVSNFLQTSASLMRRTIEPAIGERISYIDKQIRLVLDAAGPSYVNLSAIGSTLHVRRARNLYYTQSFADQLIREMVMGHAQVRTLATRCHMAAMQAGSLLSTLLPSRVPQWMPMLEDIASSTAFRSKMEKMTEFLVCGDEWHYISMDATLKLCMKVMGQASYRAPKQVRDEAPFDDTVAWRRLLTIRGRTGAVLMMHFVQSESSEQIVEAMRQNFSVEQLNSVHHVGTDSPSEKLLAELKGICQNLKSLMLDPIHLAIVYEYGFWNKKNPDKDYWQQLYDGSMARPLGDEETRIRAMILDCSMSDSETARVLDNLNPEKPFMRRLDFIKAVAALCRRYKVVEVTRKAAGPNKDINKILWAACAPDRVEWLMNNIRVRHSMRASYLWFLPSGTSSNEALHAEINSWTRTTNVLHRSTLALKLQYFLYIKTLQHYLATQFPMSHVVSASMLLGRALHESIWSSEEWSAWCAEQQTAGTQCKAELPLAKARLVEARVVRRAVKKKPVVRSTKKTDDRRKRVTPLSVKRMHTLRTAGVKRSST